MANQQDIFNLLLIWTANKINRNKTNLSPHSKHLPPKEPMLNTILRREQAMNVQALLMTWCFAELGPTAS